MGISEKIKEEVLPIRSNMGLIKELYPMLRLGDDCKYAYVAYTDTKRKMPLQGLFTNDIDGAQHQLGFREDAERFLARNNNPTFTDLLFFLNAFTDHKTYGIGIETIYEPRPFKPNPAIDDYLKSTYGYILWHYQMEALLSIFSVLPDKAVEIRKGLNRKDPKCQEMIDTLRFANGDSLLDVYVDRMVMMLMGVTRYPDYQAAYNLFNILYGAA